MCVAAAYYCLLHCTLLITICLFVNYCIYYIHFIPFQRLRNQFCAWRRLRKLIHTKRAREESVVIMQTNCHISHRSKFAYGTKFNTQNIFAHSNYHFHSAFVLHALRLYVYAFSSFANLCTALFIISEMMFSLNAWLFFTLFHLEFSRLCTMHVCGRHMCF